MKFKSDIYGSRKMSVKIYFEMVPDAQNVSGKVR